PVCGEFIPGSDYCVNTHLDICLSRGAKRKLTQSSLLDFRFSKKTTAEPTPDILNNSDEAENKGLTDGDVSTDREFSSMNGVTGSPKDSGTTSLTGCLHGSPGISKTLNTCIPSNAGLPIIKNAENDDAVEKASSCLLSAGTTSVSIDACPDADSSTTVAVDTVIVGRRFRESFELQEGMGITVVRDPQNAKDPDAVKVLYAGSDCGQMLGYLPRELAKVLAPLLDTHFMECEGFVAGLPEQQLDNVPIQLTCQKCENDNQNYEDLRYQQSLWENFLGVVRNGNFQQPSGARYQANFNTMLLDVMTNHTHLFSDTETSFLGSFKSLSNDGQRLLVKIYTRKGPWFRLSSISYCEISDVEHAAMELKLAGYIDMFSGTDVPFEHDMKEILNVLSVPEMKEILKELPKDNTNCTRRHELLSTLLSMHNNGTCTVLPKRIFKWTGTCIRVSNMADELLWLVQVNIDLA
uniref:Fanconi-associated nuclease n=1 Tax=Aegilops tauschii subsp. strangulata TaxID=200361 RepID=A0A453QVI7_AEGTS